MDRKLHIGGEQPADGWEILNARPGPHVNHVGNAKDLSDMADSIFTAVYASHILEHLDYHDEISNALKEWLRVLQPGGQVYVSVPTWTLCVRCSSPKTTLPRLDAST